MPRRYSLLDDVYYDALRRVVDALAGEGRAFCLVGGGAAQVWIASLQTNAGERRLSDEPVLSTALRRTQDLDFATRADPAEMLRVLNSVASASRSAAHVLGPRSLRLGPVAVSLTLGPEDLSGLAEQYDEFLDSRTTVAIRRGAHLDEIPTIGLEALLVTKLTRRGDKAKDILDVTQLLNAARRAGRRIDWQRVRRGVQDQSEALALLAELEAQPEEEA